MTNEQKLERLKQIQTALRARCLDSHPNGTSSWDSPEAMFIDQAIGLQIEIAEQEVEQETEAAKRPDIHTIQWKQQQMAAHQEQAMRERVQVKLPKIGEP